MYDFIFDLVSQWNCQEQERHQYLRLFPDYPKAARNQARSSAAFFAALDGPAGQAFRSYEEAQNHMAGLQEDAAFLAGLRSGIRFCLKL